MSEDVVIDNDVNIAVDYCLRIDGGEMFMEQQSESPDFSERAYDWRRKY